MLTELVPVTFVQLFSQFDAEGEGFADVETFLEVGYILLMSSFVGYKSSSIFKYFIFYCYP